MVPGEFAPWRPIPIYNEGEDFAKLISEFAVRTHPFDVWFGQNLIEITGVDFSKFQPSMRPELLLKFGY